LNANETCCVCCSRIKKMLLLLQNKTVQNSDQGILILKVSDPVDYGVRWLRLVGSLKTQVSFAKKPYKRDHILQQRPVFLRSLQIIATPCVFVYACAVCLYVLTCVRVCVHECEQTSRCVSLLGSTSRYLCVLCVHARAAKCQICSIVLQVAEYLQICGYKWRNKHTSTQFSTRSTRVHTQNTQIP